MSDNFASLTMLQSVAWFSFFSPVNSEEKNETKRQFCLSDNVAVCGMV